MSRLTLTLLALASLAAPAAFAQSAPAPEIVTPAPVEAPPAQGTTPARTRGCGGAKQVMS